MIDFLELKDHKVWKEDASDLGGKMQDTDTSKLIMDWSTSAESDALNQANWRNNTQTNTLKDSED